MTMYRCPGCPSGSESCRRCMRRLCLEHVPLGGDACLDCEIAYQRSREGMQTLPWFLLGALVPLLVFALLAPTIARFPPSGGVRSITTGIPLLDAMIMTAVLSVFAGKLAIAVRERLHRRAFNNNRPRSRDAVAID